MADQPALGQDGRLLDATEIEWYHDPDDAQPIPPSSHLQEGQRSRPVRATTGARLAAALAAEKLDEFGQPVQSFRRRVTQPLKPRGITKRKRATVDDADTDVEDENFVASSTEDGSDSDRDLMEISNEEVADMLPSKTIPEVGGKGHTRTLKAKTNSSTTTAPPTKKARACSVGVGVGEDEVEDEDSPRNVTTMNASFSSTSTFQISNTKRCKNVKRSPIYLFYELVPNASNGSPGDVGDVHYRCFHGAHKVCTIKKSMRSNLNVLVNYLRVHVKPMYQLYCILKDRDVPPTPDEIAIASGKKRLDGKTEAEYFKKLERASENIKKAFEEQQARATAPWDQEKFEQVVTEWIVACDQPFDEVEKQEFVTMMNFVRHTGPLKIPKREGIKRRVMKMGEEIIEGVREMFMKLKAKVSLSLDAWTSSNQHAFLAIIAHYVTNDGELEELLIDFRELLGEHSGENMAEAVWATMELYGLVGKIIAIVMDNASNNNTLMTSLERRCEQRGVQFPAQDARMRCMPHTIHLAAIKLLEGIGAISKAEGKKAATRGSNYQDTIATPLSREHDHDATDDNEIDDITADLDMDTDVADGVLPAIEKLRKIVKAVRSSPQRRQSWAREIQFAQLEGSRVSEEPRASLMLILDVRTRWASTHQMLRRALDYRDTIDSFVSRNKDLHAYELSNTDWESIKLVTSWLKSFRLATTEMSATKVPMLSTTHAIFRSLQEDIKTILCDLPNSVSPKIKLGLVDAHRKLSDYYYRFDESPFYTWAALLDPRISYEGMKADYADDPMLSDHLEQSKANLFDYFNDNYANASVLVPMPTSESVQPAPTVGSPQKSFTSRYRRKEKLSINELEEYFKLPAEDFDACNPIRWWCGRQAQFPNLYSLACDILCIPGSAVAVERIFSGGRDTISLRRASLNASTIRILMLVKKRLHLTRARANVALRH